MFEMVMMNLRLKAGMEKSLFEETFAIRFEEAFKGKYEPLAEQGLLGLSETAVFCTEKGFPVLNSVLEELL
jgi:oxygen-independent coproporphyrinogen-3 oxidase